MNKISLFSTQTPFGVRTAIIINERGENIINDSYQIQAIFFGICGGGGGVGCKFYYNMCGAFFYATKANNHRFMHIYDLMYIVIVNLIA